MMTRPTKSRILYGLTLSILFLACGLIVWKFDFGPTGVVLLALILILPGRLASFFWRDFYLGQQQMRAGLYEQAKESFKKFLSQLQANPWRKRLIYGKWGIYTWDIEVTTLNNLGAVAIELNELATAAQYFESALKLDPLYPLPYANLAVLSYVKDEEQQALQLFNQARLLGCQALTEEQTQHQATVIRRRINAGL